MDILDLPQFCSREKVDGGLNGAVDKHEELAPEEPRGPGLDPQEEGVVMVLLLHTGLVLIYPVGDEGEPTV